MLNEQMTPLTRKEAIMMRELDTPMDREEAILLGKEGLKVFTRDEALRLMRMAASNSDAVELAGDIPVDVGLPSDTPPV